LHERHRNLAAIMISSGKRKGRTVDLHYMTWRAVQLL